MDQSLKISEVLRPLHLLNHPFYQDWMAGKLTTDTLKDYATQYFSHVRAFPRYLGAIHSFCENETDRQMILENLNDEEGVSYGTSHPELWLRFAEGLGVSREQLSQAEFRQGITQVVETFFRFARSSFHEGLGALYAYEHQVPEIATSKIQGLQQMYAITDEKTLEFFTVHEKADVYHRQTVEKILFALPEKQREEAFAAAQVAAQSLWDFLTEVHGKNTNVLQ